MTKTKIFPLQQQDQTQVAECGHGVADVKQPHFHYGSDGRVLMTITTDAGDIAFAMTPSVFMHSINDAVRLMNEHFSLFLGEIVGR